MHWPPLAPAAARPARQRAWVTRDRRDKGIRLEQLRQAQQLVAGYVLLLLHALGHICPTVRCGTERKHHHAFHLLRNNARVDHQTASNGTRDTVHLQLAASRRYLGDWRHDGAKRFMQCNTLGRPRRQGVFPPSPAGRQLQHDQDSAGLAPATGVSVPRDPVSAQRRSRRQNFQRKSIV